MAASLTDSKIKKILDKGYKQLTDSIISRNYDNIPDEYRNKLISYADTVRQYIANKSDANKEQADLAVYHLLIDFLEISSNSIHEHYGTHISAIYRLEYIRGIIDKHLIE